QMVDDPSHVRLPRIMALPSIILIPPPESPLVESIARKPYDMDYGDMIHITRLRLPVAVIERTRDTQSSLAPLPSRRNSPSISWKKPFSD
ncbi:MAG: hypothetical protein ABR878_00005, partial [Roseiarcus sp.]